MDRDDARRALLERRRREGERDGEGFASGTPSGVYKAVTTTLAKAGLWMWPAMSGGVIVADEKSNGGFCWRVKKQ